MNDGGPAFPIIDKMESSLIGHPDYTGSVRGGMTLRDYFAAAALQGRGQEWGEDGFGFEKIAVLAYAQADAMLAEMEQSK